jgi:hypothetical protein
VFINYIRFKTYFNFNIKNKPIFNNIKKVFNKFKIKIVLSLNSFIFISLLKNP